MTVSHFIRRTHLYLGLSLLPWVFMYGISSLPFTHGQYFQQRDEAKKLPLWNLRFERPLDVPVPTEREEMKAFGRNLLKELGIEGPTFNVNRPNPNTVNIGSSSFLHATRVVYAVDKKKVTVEDRRFRIEQMLAGMHTRAGYEQDGFLQDSWGFMVDAACVGMVLWVLTGFYMWWGVAGHRAWGWVAILAGFGSFALFTLKL